MAVRILNTTPVSLPEVNLKFSIDGAWNHEGRAFSTFFVDGFGVVTDPSPTFLFVKSCSLRSVCSILLIPVNRIHVLRRGVVHPLLGQCGVAVRSYRCGNRIVGAFSVPFLLIPRYDKVTFPIYQSRYTNQVPQLR
jgi:hypothetical protein